mgnify:CR=1 FL=1
MQGRKCLPCNPREVARASSSTTTTTQGSSARPKKMVLRLKEPPAADTPKVSWAEGTVNNEGMNKRSSKSK